MAQKPADNNGGGGSIKVGTTGTIGSLMTRELESTKVSTEASSSCRKKPQTSPVSVPCGHTPKKSQQRKNPANESSSRSISGNGKHEHKNQGINQKPRHTSCKNGHRVPMLGVEDIAIDRSPKDGKVNRKGHTYIVEVVDLKCSNKPMSSHLKKLGFSKLSETFA